MPHYHTLGQIPPKRHTQFRRPNGELYYEELVSTEGFSSIYSLVYHLALIERIGEPADVAPKVAVRRNIQHRSFLGFKTEPTDDFLESRKILYTNKDCHIGVAAPKKSMTTYFYKNAQADEMLFIHEGTGTLKSPFGDLPFGPGDYLVIPRGIVYQMHFDGEGNRIFFVESFSPLETPTRYRNRFGQMEEHSPFCERDFKLPTELETYDEKGDFLIKVKKEGMIHEMIYATHPFDVVGSPSFTAIIRLITSAGTAISSPTPSRFTISSRLPDAYICRRRSIRPSKARDLWFAASARGCMIIIRWRFRRRTRTATSTATKSCIMWKANS